MAFIIAFAVIAAVSIIKAAWDKHDIFLSLLITIAFTFVGAIIGLIPAFFFTLIYSDVPGSDMSNFAMSETAPVTAAADTVGSVRGIYAYRSADSILYIQETELGYKESSVESSRTFIRYTDENTEPHIETRTADTVPAKLFTVPGCLNMTNVYILYVPEGSIVVDGSYEFDLE